jgi:hypothetical protein
MLVGPKDVSNEQAFVNAGKNLQLPHNKRISSPAENCQLQERPYNMAGLLLYLA